MLEKLTVNPISGKLQKISHLPQLDFDPDSPKSEDAWVLAQTSGTGVIAGESCGLLLLLTHGVSTAEKSYQLSYQTKEGTTQRIGGAGIGTSVTSGTPRSILFIDEDGNLGEDPNFTYSSENRLSLRADAPAGGSPLGILASITQSINLVRNLLEILSSSGDIHFAIDSNGNLIKLNSVDYSWPTTQGAPDTVLKNDGSGTLTWEADSSSSTSIPFILRPTSSGTGTPVGILASITASISGLQNILEIRDLSNNLLFCIDSDGNITKARSVAYSFPSTQGAAGTYLRNDGTGNLSWTFDRIRQLSADPVSPTAEDAWVKRTVNSGRSVGILASITTSNPDTYQFSYRTNEGTTVRSTLS